MNEDSKALNLQSLKLFNHSLEKYLQPFKALQKSLAKLKNASELGLSQAKQLSERFEQIQMQDKTLEQDCQRLAEQLKEHYWKARQLGLQELLQGLRATLPKPELIELISDKPLVLALPPLQLEVNFDDVEASLSYAREKLCTVPAEVPAIVQAYHKELDELRRLRLDASSFFNILKKAYEICLLRDSLEPGTRISLVDVLPVLAWLWPLPLAKNSAALPRHLLAYQLHRLWHERALEQAAWRLELGDATGGSTKNKNKVLYVPYAQQQGQYYLSLAFKKL